MCRLYNSVIILVYDLQTNNFINQAKHAMHVRCRKATKRQSVVCKGASKKFDNYQYFQFTPKLAR